MTESIILSAFGRKKPNRIYIALEAGGKKSFIKKKMIQSRYRHEKWVYLRRGSTLCYRSHLTF